MREDGPPCTGLVGRDVVSIFGFFFFLDDRNGDSVAASLDWCLSLCPAAHMLHQLGKECRGFFRFVFLCNNQHPMAFICSLLGGVCCREHTQINELIADICNNASSAIRFLCLGWMWHRDAADFKHWKGRAVVNCVIVPILALKNLRSMGALMCQPNPFIFSSS
jgi:hypothetical protein